DGAASEGDTSNNKRARTLDTTASPDLVVQSLSATLDTTQTSGPVINITDTTKNQGAGSAGSSTTRFFLSLDAIWDSGAAPLGVRRARARGGGHQRTGVAPGPVPGTFAPGSYFIIARVDGGNVVGESDEANRPQNTAPKTAPVPGLLLASWAPPGSPR